MNEIYCSRREASPQLVGTNNAKTKASFCEVFFRISGDGAHFVKFFPGLSFLSEKIRSPARGGSWVSGCRFLRQERRWLLHLSVVTIVTQSRENFKVLSLSCSLRPCAVRTRHRFFRLLARLRARQHLELATPGCVGRRRPAPGRSRCDGGGREGA